jgi:ribose-phosphate pyrophosphokinase
MSGLLLHAPSDEALASRLGALLEIPVAPLGLHRFPDGESLVTVAADVAGCDVHLVANLREPDLLALPLWFAAHTARELGARSVTLVAPYLAYMRQDVRFAPGQAVSAPLFARFVEGAFDRLVTVDPHLHRIPALDRIYAIPAIAASATHAIAAWLRDEVPDAVLIGPDAESAQWVDAIATRAGLPSQVLSKLRRGDRDVEVSSPDAATLHGRTPVLVDDIVSSGHTLLQAIAQLEALGAAPPVVVVVHALFAGDSYDLLQASRIARVASTDTLPHPTNRISVASAVAEAIRAVQTEAETHRGDSQ